MKFIYIVFPLILLASCADNEEQKITTDLVRSSLTADKNAKEVAMPRIEVDTDFYDFTKITQGESVSADFVIKNTGDAPLLIRSAKGSCGCTVPQWPKEPISEGEKAIIKVTFNSAGKEGSQNKTVTLVTNAIPSTKVLTIKGNVIVPKKQ
ncbi:DUF1573 domain-containing protein [Flavobacteriales bacterium]|nr:DUF1573 domain-containing protein [Flavobacteriales bacterium]